MAKLFASVLMSYLAASACNSAAVEMAIKAKGELLLQKTEPEALVNKAWFNGGSGQLTYNSALLNLAPQYLSIDAATDSAFSARVHAQWHAQPEAGVSVTEAWVNWAPLPVSGYRWRGRLGYFYPQMSLENTDTAWTSPYSSTFSAINSWVAEEVRARGAELSLSRPGQFFKSNHSVSALIGVFEGNDPAGTLLAWRGFALHNLQTGLGERINFADYPSLQAGGLALQSPWVEPTRELDHRRGFYLGAHWQYQQRTELRLYYYDNNADPLVFSHQQYAWHTRFASMALRHNLNEEWQLLAQWLQGDTLMGPGAVDADFAAWFVLAHWQRAPYSLTLRYDDFSVTDNDLTANDDNNGKGSAWLFALSYQLSAHFSLSVEHIALQSQQQNRQQWSWPVSQPQSVSKLVLTWRW